MAIGKDLLHLADIRILHGQDLAVAAELERLLGLGPIAQDLVTGWGMAGKGRALWCVGEQMYKVQTVLHTPAHALTFTTDAFTPAGSGRADGESRRGHRPPRARDHGRYRRLCTSCLRPRHAPPPCRSLHD